MSTCHDRSGRFTVHTLVMMLALAASAPLWGSPHPISGERSPVRFGGDTITKIYSLIHFEMDSARLTPVQRRILEDYVFEGITSERDPIVEVVGHTDVMGTIEHNKRLSLRRAEAVAGAIRKGIRPGRYRSLIARGAGEEEMRYRNDLPEGRFYNRTVRVRVTASRDS